MSESWLWKSLKSNLKINFMERVENKVSPGWGDVHYSHKGKSGWLELKYEDKVPSKIRFEPAQPGWLYRYWKSGGDCYVLLYTKIDNTIRIWPGSDALALSDEDGVRKVEPSLSIEMNQEGWKIIKRAIFCP